MPVCCKRQFWCVPFCWCVCWQNEHDTLEHALGHRLSKSGTRAAIHSQKLMFKTSMSLLSSKKQFVFCVNFQYCSYLISPLSHFNIVSVKLRQYCVTRTCRDCWYQFSERVNIQTEWGEMVLIWLPGGSMLSFFSFLLLTDKQQHSVSSQFFCFTKTDF